MIRTVLFYTFALCSVVLAPSIASAQYYGYPQQGWRGPPPGYHQPRMAPPRYGYPPPRYGHHPYRPPHMMPRPRPPHYAQPRPPRHFPPQHPPRRPNYGQALIGGAAGFIGGGAAGYSMGRSGYSHARRYSAHSQRTMYRSVTVAPSPPRFIGRVCNPCADPSHVQNPATCACRYTVHVPGSAPYSPAPMPPVSIVRSLN